MKLTKSKIIKFLNTKGIEYGVEKDKIVLKYCLLDNHTNKWCTVIWFEDTKNDWYFMCNGSHEHYNEAFPFAEFVRICKNNIDKIRNINAKNK
ncbi:MAG: hypothetical protein WC711_00130 [Candidatus Staskawiczbacteria bacterium]|jgi:hypothetical protein